MGLMSLGLMLFGMDRPELIGWITLLVCIAMLTLVGYGIMYGYW